MSCLPTLFKKNTLLQVLKFLDNETGIAEELKIMNSVPLRAFLPASLQEIFSSRVQLLK
jgi:hypothetical protein